MATLLPAVCKPVGVCGADGGCGGEALPELPFEFDAPPELETMRGRAYGVGRLVVVDAEETAVQRFDSERP